MPGYYAFWKERNETPDVIVEFLGNYSMTWSGKIFDWDERYTYPVAKFKIGEAERMLRLNPDMFRMGEVIIPDTVVEREPIFHRPKPDETAPAQPKRRGRRKSK